MTAVQRHQQLFKKHTTYSDRNNMRRKCTSWNKTVIAVAKMSVRVRLAWCEWSVIIMKSLEIYQLLGSSWLWQTIDHEWLFYFLIHVFSILLLGSVEREGGRKEGRREGGRGVKFKSSFALHKGLCPSTTSSMCTCNRSKGVLISEVACFRCSNSVSRLEGFHHLSQYLTWMGRGFSLVHSLFHYRPQSTPARSGRNRGRCLPHEWQCWVLVRYPCARRVHA